MRERKLKYRPPLSIRFRVYLETLILHPYPVMKHIWKQLLVLFSMIAFGAYVFSYFQRLDPLSALLASVSTISTIGLYAPPITSIPNIEKVMLIGIILTSVGSAASLVQGIVNSVVKTDLCIDEVQRTKIKYMKNHVIIIGYTQIGKYVADRLIEMKKDFCVITRRKENVKELQDRGIPYVPSDLSSPIDALNAANVQSASVIISALESDELNLLYALTTMHMNPQIRTVTINNSDQIYESLKEAGVHVVIPIYRLIGSMLASATVTENVVGVVTEISKRMPGMEIVEIEVKKDSRLDGMRISELPLDYFVLIREGGPVKYISPDLQLRPGDRILALVGLEGLRAVQELTFK
ncbi:MAG: potassium channel family protein [Nitrososphaeria archaeon]